MGHLFHDMFHTCLCPDLDGHQKPCDTFSTFRLDICFTICLFISTDLGPRT